MAYTPFFQGTEATNIINGYLDQNVNANTPMAQPDMNQYGVFRNPYSPEGFYANETDQYPVEFVPPVTDEEGIPACPEGYIYDEVMKACRYVGFSEPNQDNGKTFEEERAEERPYMSIEDMKNASDEELLNYMTSGFLKNSPLGYLPSKGTEVTMSNMFMPSQFQLLFGKQNEMRKNFIKDELTRRGYFTGNFDKNKNPLFDIGSKNVNTNTGGIESLLPQNVQGQPVTDVFGDTYQQVANDGQGNTGYTFTSGTPLPTPRTAGRGGTSSNQMTGGGIIINQTPQPPQMTDAQRQYMEDYDK